jgi:hypothetical protein
MALSMLNFLEKGFGKALLKLNLTKITFNKKIYIPRTAEAITLEKIH